MDDLTFFNTILPATGLRCIALPRPDGKWHHIWGPDNAWLERMSKQIDTARQIDVYFGCSSYLTRTRRKQSNTAWMRSFWADLDVGVSEPGKPAKYTTQKEAAAAILGFSKKLGLPRPFIVNSGWGVHAYWAMDADIEPGVWKATAQALKRALRAEGILYDPTRTADEASVLRPPGTHNRKRAPKLVKVVVEGDVVSLHAFQLALVAHMGAAPAADPFAAMGPAPVGLGKASSDLGAGVDYDPSSAHKIADACGIIGMIRDTRGRVDQPTWYNALGVLAYTEEAPDICHEWSVGDPRYSKAETDAKLDQVSKFPPTGCEKLGEQHGAICAACPHQGKIKSPIVLGRERPQPSTVEVVERKVAADGTIRETRRPLDLPYPYGETIEEGRRVLTYTAVKTDKDGTVSRDTSVICNSYFWATTRLWVDHASQVEFEMETREGPRRFIMESSIIGKGGKDVAGALASNEIVARGGKGPQLQGYLTGWLEHLTKTSDQVMAYRSFGWNAGRFVLGDAVLNPDGVDTRSILIGAAKAKGEIVSEKGDLDTWVALVDRAYNAPGQEAFQFQIACAFAAPLLSLMQQVRGLTVYSHTDGSGAGKTTVQQVGLSAWGHWEDMMLAHGKTTTNAMWGLMGAYNSLPVVYDELTNAPNADVSELVFSVSSGRAKERMNSSGETRSNNSNWSTILLASGNTTLSEKLSLHRTNAEAEISRLFEFTLNVEPHLTVAEANALFPLFHNHYGHAGKAFARYVTMNREQVEKMLQATQKRLVAELEMTQMERHWSALFAAVLVALALCRQQGLLAFDIAGLKAWMVGCLKLNRGQRVSMVATPEDQIGLMLNDLWDGVLVTLGEGDRRTGGPAARVEKHPKGPIVGRAINPLLPGDVAQLRISRAAIREWASRKGTSADTMFNTAVSLGWCSDTVDRYSFGKGTLEYPSGTTTVPCWKFNLLAMDRGATGQVVQQLVPLQGGKGKP